jgi:hypothetical protein
VTDGVAVDGTFERDAPAVSGVGTGGGGLVGRCPERGEGEKENEEKGWTHWEPVELVRRVPIGDNIIRENVENFRDLFLLSVRDKKVQA